MDHNLQIWLTVACVAIAVSALIEIVFLAMFLRLSAMLRPAPGRPTLSEIVDRVLVTTTALERATKSMAEMLDELKPLVNQVSSISQRQLEHAEHVAGEVLTTVERINHSVDSTIGKPFREMHALSAAVRSAATALFGANDGSSKEKHH